MSSTTTRSIMVVDDEMELANMFKSFLENEGYNAITFVDPVGPNIVVSPEFTKDIMELRSTWVIPNATDCRVVALPRRLVGRKYDRLCEQLQRALLILSTP